MKAITGIFCALFLSLALTAGGTCDRLALYDNGNLQLSYEQDLTTHVWRSGLLGSMSTLYFRDDGLVLVISDNASRAETYTWDVQVDDGRPMLRFFSRNGEKQYCVSPVCSGLSVSIDGKGRTMLFSEEDAINDSKVRMMQSMLTGTWKYQPAPREKNSMSPLTLPFSLSLLTDGTFVLAMEPDTEHSTCQGVWQVSADGDYLVLYMQSYRNGKMEYIPETMPLRSFDFEDLVVAAGPLPRALSAWRGSQPLYLSKDNS